MNNTHIPNTFAIQMTSRAMGYGAIKYADLKSNRTTNYRFSYDDMLSMQVCE